MDSTVIKVAYVGAIDPFVRRLYRYEYLGTNILSIKPSISSLIGADFSYYKQEDVHYQIWEIDSEKKFDIVKAAYMKGCMAGIVLFDLHSLEKVKQITELIEDIWNNNGNGYIPIALVGIREIYSELNQEVINSYNSQIKDLIQKYEQHRLNLAFFESNLQYGENFKEIFSFFNYLYKHSHLENELSTDMEYHTRKSQVKIIESSQEIIQYITRTNYNSKLLLPRRIEHLKCIADRSIIQITDDNNFICNKCKSNFCKSCYEFYSMKENLNLDCPGTNSKKNIHKPNFSTNHN